MPVKEYEYDEKKIVNAQSKLVSSCSLDRHQFNHLLDSALPRFPICLQNRHSACDKGKHHRRKSLLKQVSQRCLQILHSRLQFTLHEGHL